MRPLRPCNQPGCPELVRPPERYCQTHRWTDEQRDEYRRERYRQRQRRYDRHKRDRRAKRFYDSTAWQRLRRMVLNRHNHLCVMCRTNSRIVLAEHVDHIIPISVDWERRLDPDNCQSLCASCHSRKTATDVRG